MVSGSEKGWVMVLMMATEWVSAKSRPLATLTLENPRIPQATTAIL